jgi:signal transduction histidine kinase
MTFRARVLAGFLVVVLVPLLVFAVGTRRLVRERLAAQYDRRVELLVTMLEQDMAQQGRAVTERIEALAGLLAEDNRFRQELQGNTGARGYVLDYAGVAMRQSGLDMLLVLDQDGRILSSGHFRNEYDRHEPGLVSEIAAADTSSVMVPVRTAAGGFTVIARAKAFRLGGRDLGLVGGVDVQQRLIDRWNDDEQLAVALELPGPGGTSDTAGGGDARLIVRDVPVVYLAAAGPDEPRIFTQAHIRVTHSLASLQGLTRAVDRWFLLALIVTSLAALGVAGWVSVRLSRPLTALAEKTADVDLDNLDVDFTSARTDEIGSLSRLMGAMTARLKASAARLRDAERRATVGEFARQVNHDIKNGLTPIRNVVRHFNEVARDAPVTLPEVFIERQGTLDSSLSYLEDLAANYARLSPVTGTGPCDVAAVVRRVIAGAQALGVGAVRANIAQALPLVRGDPVVVQRVLENLVRNAVASLDGDGSVTVSAAPAPEALPGGAVRLTVADTGRGITQEELRRIFEDFYTTTAGGTGLGLSIVRRLVGDLGGRLAVESEPGVGTRVTVDLPIAVDEVAPAVSQSRGADG